MPQGLQIWDAAGNLVLDATSSTGIILGTVSTGTENGAVDVPRLAEGNPFWFVNTEGLPLFNSRLPAVRRSGTTLIWEFLGSGSENMASTISYGIF